MSTHPLTRTTSKVKNYLKVKINQNVEVSTIPSLAKSIADEVYRQMPKDRMIEVEFKISLDFSELKTISKETRKMIMDYLQEELLRCE